MFLQGKILIWNHKFVKKSNRCEYPGWFTEITISNKRIYCLYFY